jgi:polyhydroxybutyrate depolymerase
MRTPRQNLFNIPVLLGLLACGICGCGQSSGGGTAGSGASGGTAGNTMVAGGSGGHIGLGGTTSAGGAVSSGGSEGSGGVHASGGTTAIAASGGTMTGGSSAVGGAGGIDGSGGSSAKGGNTGAGGGSADAGRADSAAGGNGTGVGGSGGTGTGGAGAGGSTGSVVCPSPALKSGDSTKNITVGTLGREYILHVPSAYTGSTAVPLVIDFHPIGGSDTSWRSGSPYPAVIDKEGVISAFPNGEPSPNMGNAWDVEGCCTTADDVAFARAVVADIEKVACIDTKRVYAVGFSMGGGMSNYLACHAADVFAAVGPASFDLTQQNEGDCKPTRPLTVIEWRGKNDNVVPYAGGHSALVTGMAIDFLGAVGTFQKWASLDGCTGNPSAADSNNCQTYSECSASVQVTLCTDNNGGHEAANAGVVWPMLKKYTMP